MIEEWRQAWQQTPPDGEAAFVLGVMFRVGALILFWYGMASIFFRLAYDVRLPNPFG